jgi:peptidoglycan hydrolase-like protein with peptidoglycan-binding domain
MLPEQLLFRSDARAKLLWGATAGAVVPPAPAPLPLSLTTPRMRGPAVREVQQQLALFGYKHGPLDGIYGPLTAQAVRAFQADHRLVADGIVGPKTRVAFATALGLLAITSTSLEGPPPDPGMC